MKPSLRKRKTFNYYSFTFYDSNKNKLRVPKEKHPIFLESQYKEALLWASSQEAKHIAKTIISEKKDLSISWSNILRKYEDRQKKRTPSSYRTNIYCINNFVIPFFKFNNKILDVNVWHRHSHAFKEWLENDSETTKGNRPSYSTLNSVIRSTNSLLTFLAELNYLKPENRFKIEFFKKRYLNQRSYDDIIKNEEYHLVCSYLGKLNPITKSFFKVMMHTGLRFSELYSLRLIDIVQAKTPSELHEELKRYSMDYFGYICLESQSNQKRPRDPNGNLIRKPLKGRTQINEANSRIIPIFNKDAWGILLNLRKEAWTSYETKKYGANKENYLLFLEGYNNLIKSFRNAWIKLGLKPKSFHCCRHTYSTNLLGTSKSFFLARTILGHRSESILEHYNHLHAKMNRQARLQEMKKELKTNLIF
ncbi:Integrase (XerC) [uncultured Mediterranean phage uvMED]|nr:Integrase (XerC) [uncultured Mediterranean phage uvMED]